MSHEMELAMRPRLQYVLHSEKTAFSFLYAMTTTSTSNDHANQQIGDVLVNKNQRWMPRVGAVSCQTVQLVPRVDT